MDGGEGGGISKEEEGRPLRDLVGKGEQLCEAVAVVQSVEPAFFSSGVYGVRFRLWSLLSLLMDRCKYSVIALSLCGSTLKLSDV